MNSPKVFTLSQLLPSLGALTKTIGVRNALMTEPLAGHLPFDHASGSTNKTFTSLPFPRIRSIMARKAAGTCRRPG
jgi:hypothetical protein